MEEWFNVNGILQLYRTDRHSMHYINMININSIKSNNKNTLIMGNTNCIKKKVPMQKSSKMLTNQLFFHEQIHFTVTIAVFLDEGPPPYDFFDCSQSQLYIGTASYVMPLHFTTLHR